MRWHFAFAAEKSGTAPGSLAPFLNPSSRPSLAQRASPAVWQRVLVASSVLVALCLGVFLTHAYQPRGPLVWILATAGLIVGLGLSAISFIGWRTYGTAAHPDAARSVC